MPAKQVQISADDIAYFLLPGGSGEISREGAVVDDTIFGQTYKSGLTGPIVWGINANAVYKGYPGYVANLKKPGTPTAAVGEACTLVSGKTYQINNTSKRVWDRSVVVVVKDGVTTVTGQVDNIDYLFGTVTFKTSYTVVGAVTVDVTYFPLVSLGKYTGYTLTMTADPLRDSDMPTLQTNGGYHTHKAGLKTVGIELPTVYNATDNWPDKLDDRAEFIIEVNPDGTGVTGSLARGFFRLATQRQSGNVGALEEEGLNFTLNVPFASAQPYIATPFGWSHGAGSPIPTAIKTSLDRWLADQTVYAKYLHDGLAGWKGQGVLTSLTLSGGMEVPNSFAVALQMSGAPSII